MRPERSRFEVPPICVDALNEVARAHGSHAVHGRARRVRRAAGAAVGHATTSPIGTPVAGRGEQALDDLVGMFVNTLVLRTRSVRATPFTELLADVRERDLGAFAHADVPFERLVEVLDPARSRRRHPLFQVMLIVPEHGRRPPWSCPVCASSSCEPSAESAKFDLQLTLSERSTAGPGVRVDARAQLRHGPFRSDRRRVFARAVRARCSRRSSRIRARRRRYRVSTPPRGSGCCGR